MTKLTEGKNKDFSKDLEIIIELLQRNENFAFSRFSDGETYMLNKHEIQMASNFIRVGDLFDQNSKCAKDDIKHYDPKKHEFYRQRLEESLVFRKNNYYKGISCRCCIAGGGDEGEKYFKWTLEKIGPGDEHNLTWSNLFINSNYISYLKKVVPIFATKKIVFIVNENADISKLNFNVVKRFSITENCMINNYEIIEEIKEYIKQNNIKNHVFLIAASFLTNMINHQVFSIYDNNTFIDIGSSLNPFMPGIESRRTYMNQINGGPIDTKKCIW